MIIGLQVGRAIAALLVLLHHISINAPYYYGGEAFNSIFHFGHVGVDFFFVLSGFIIYWVHSSDKESLESAKIYFWKRFIRIYPPFILISVVLLIAYTLMPNLSHSDREISILSSLFLVPTQGSPALSVSWTLMHELLFYILFLCFFL